MGVFEMAKFEAGTKGLMDAVVEATKAGKTTIIGKKSINIVQKDTRNMSVVFSTSPWDNVSRICCYPNQQLAIITQKKTSWFLMVPVIEHAV